MMLDVMVRAQHTGPRISTEGTPDQLGVTWLADVDAYNFALYSRNASEVTLLLYGENDPIRPVCRHRFDRFANKTGPIWHCRLAKADLHGATLYAYRVDGPNIPGSGNSFDGEKILLDPFAPAVYFPPSFDRLACRRPGPNDGQAPLGRLPKPEYSRDWEDLLPPRHGHDAIIYEMHVKGFTARANSGASPENRGTFAGVIEKIPYLKDLGVTILELLPVHQADPREPDYWHYMTLNFFSPAQEYAAGDAFEEFREMVRALHKADIEVWLDVVYNHTCEGDQQGPVYSYRGIDNASYYVLTPDGQRYLDCTGCGNMLNASHPVVRMLVSRSLQFWRDQMHIDGFRFDLASALCRSEDGSLEAANPPLITEISTLANFTGIQLVAEAWDIETNQLGRSFPGTNWRQWNGHFRDDMRRWLRGDPGLVGAAMQRLYGSDDLFPDTLYDAQRPYQSVNFVTAHDGFCLYDLVSYNWKHNAANGEDSNDGAGDNLSWNCGWEGDAGATLPVLALRRRQIKNFFALLMLSNGTPMFCAGDEFMNTQGGNNNPYNQDNETTWLDWDLQKRNLDIYRFFKQMIAFRKAHPSIGRSRYWRQDVHWYGVDGPADWGYESRHLAYALLGESEGDDDLYVMINMHWQDADFTIQEGEPGEWLRAVDTAQEPPLDIAEGDHETPVSRRQYTVKARSVVVLRRLHRPFSLALG